MDLIFLVNSNYLTKKLTCVSVSDNTMLRNADGGGVSNVLEKKRYEGVRFNVISVTRGWVGVQFPEKAVRNT